MKAWIKVPSPAMGVALLALFVALGGSAYAVNKIGTKQIKNNAITTAKVKNGAVKTAKISNGAVANAKLGERSVTQSKIAPGAVRGNRLSIIRVEGEEVTMNPGTSEIAEARCPEGRQAISYTWDNTLGVTYYYTQLSEDSVLLYALAPSEGEGPFNATATVVCA